MQVRPIQNNMPSFRILKGYKKTPYGDYMWGVYKNYKIDVYNATKHDQKLIYVSDNKFLNWIKSKLFYIQDGVKKVIRSESR